MEYSTSEPRWPQERLQESSPPLSPINSEVGQFSQPSEPLPFYKAEHPALEPLLASAVNIPVVSVTSAGYFGQDMNLSDPFPGLNGAKTTLSYSPTYTRQPPKRDECMEYLRQGSLPNGTDGRNMPPYGYGYQTQGIGFIGGAPPFQRLVYGFWSLSAPPIVKQRCSQLRRPLLRNGCASKFPSTWVWRPSPVIPSFL